MVLCWLSKQAFDLSDRLLFFFVQIDIVVGMEYRPGTVDQLSGSVFGSSLLDDDALSLSLGFAGNVQQNGATIRIRNDRSIPFSVRPQGFSLTASAFLQFCTQGVMAYSNGPYVPAVTTMRLATTNGSIYSLVSTSGNSSQISSDGRCFTAHAIISNITAGLDVAYIDIEFLPSLANRSLAACSDVLLVRLANGSCVTPQQDPGLLAYMPIFINQSIYFASSQVPQGSALQFVGVQDIEPPVFTFCPGNQTIVAPASSLSVWVNWTLPTATDDVQLESMLSLTSLTGTNVSGNTVSRLLSVARSVYTVEYIATDTSKNKRSCRQVMDCLCFLKEFSVVCLHVHLSCLGVHFSQVRDPDPDQ
jgi:hypothetical protein